MNSPAFDIRAWREAGIQAFGYAACAALFQAPAPPANDSIPPPRGGMRRRGMVRPVGSVTPSFAPDPAPGPAQREMPLLAVVDGQPPRLSRADTMTARRRILNDPEVSRAGKAVARAMFAHQWYGKTDCWPGYKRMAEVAGVSERTIARGVSNLIERGYIARERRGRLGNPKGGRRSNRYGLQLEFCFGRKPTNPAKLPDDINGQESATVRTATVESGGHDNRSTSKTTNGPMEKTEAKATSTPVRHGGGGGDGPPCPKCSASLTIDRSWEGVSVFCLRCGHNGSFTPSHQFGRTGNYKDNLAYKRRRRIRSRPRGNSYADLRAGGDP